MAGNGSWRCFRVSLGIENASMTLGVQLSRGFGIAGFEESKMDVVETFESLLDRVQSNVPEVLLQEVWGNSLLRISAAAVFAVLLAFGSVLIVRLVQSRIRKLSRGTQTQWDDRLANILDATSSFLVFLASFLVGALLLALPKDSRDTIGSIIFLILVLQAGLYFRRALAETLLFWSSGPKAPSRTMVSAARFLGNLVIWSLLLFVAMSTFGIEISALLAGLGIGGVAAALAVQNLLGDLFAAVSLYTDRPFDVGDFIIIGDDLGTVTHIGWRTTRLASLGGQELTVPNSDLATSRINNYTRMKERRVVFDVGVVYSTPLEKLQKIPTAIREAVEEADNTRFDRSHIKAFGPSSYDFETVYYVESRDYNVHMDALQQVLFGVIARFKAMEVDFAFPSRSLYLESVGPLEGSKALFGVNGSGQPATLSAADGA